MNKILFVSGTSGNGGTQTWTREYLKSYNNNEFELVHVNLSARRGLEAEASTLKRIVDGLLDLREVYRDVKKALIKGHYQIMHTATSGSLGTLRDYFLAKLAKRYKTKSILHCHYGCIKEDYTKGGLLSYLLKKTIPLYDEILVLDSISMDFINGLPGMTGRVHVAPNFIEINSRPNLEHNKYKDIAFIGNIVPSKGVLELIEAVKSIPNTTLTLIGPSTREVALKLKEVIGEDEGKCIFSKGHLSNMEAVEFMTKVGILALPTYYHWEAFPISILEAMSNGCLVLSCPRAAIPDMLTNEKGDVCGLMVEPKSVDSIVDAIKWAQEHSLEADELRRKAYDKVCRFYSKTIVFDLYTKIYKRILEP